MRWRVWRKAETPRWPATINGYTTRPEDGDCPSCGADEALWCEPGCLLLDPMDYR